MITGHVVIKFNRDCLLAGKLVLAVEREPSCNLCPELHCNTREEHRDTPGEERHCTQPVKIVNDVNYV